MQLHTHNSQSNSHNNSLNNVLNNAQNKLQQVNYSEFRQLLSVAAGPKIKSKGKKTYMYDHNNHILAVLKPASIDTFGRTNRAQYFVRSAA